MLDINKNKTNRISCHYLIYNNKKIAYPIISIYNNKIINISQMKQEEEAVIFINGLIDLDKKIYSSQIYTDINKFYNVDISDIHSEIIGLSFDIL